MDDPKLKVVIEGDASSVVGASTEARHAIDQVGDSTRATVPKLEEGKRGFADQKKSLDDIIEQHKKILQAIEDEELAESKGDQEKEAAIHARFAGRVQELDRQKELGYLVQKQLDDFNAALKRATDALAEAEKNRDRFAGQAAGLGDQVTQQQQEFQRHEQTRAMEQAMAGVAAAGGLGKVVGAYPQAFADFAQGNPTAADAQEMQLLRAILDAIKATPAQRQGIYQEILSGLQGQAAADAQLQAQLENLAQHTISQ